MRDESQQDHLLTTSFSGVPSVSSFGYIRVQRCSSPGNFFPTILKSFGFTNTITLLITCPPYSECLASGEGT